MKVIKKANGRVLISELLDSIDFVKHLFSTRDYGNQGLHTGDIREKVLENRKILSEEIDVDYKNIITSQQVHGNKVYRVYKDDRGAGALNYDSSIVGCDALITDSPMVPLFAFFADCVPVFLVDTKRKAIGLVHSGWKGTLGNIVSNAIEEFKNSFGTDVNDVIAVIGPYIKKECYETSDEIIEEFKQKGYESIDFIEGNNIDLGNIIKKQLLDKGIKNIEFDDHCTSCDSDEFYSFRRDKGKTGRMAGMMIIRGE